MKAKDFTTITRDDGKQQTAYKGRPLYYFFADNMPGVLNGRADKDKWYGAKV